MFRTFPSLVRSSVRDSKRYSGRFSIRIFKQQTFYIRPFVIPDSIYDVTPLFNIPVFSSGNIHEVRFDWIVRPPSPPVFIIYFLLLSTPVDFEWKNVPSRVPHSSFVVSPSIVPTTESVNYKFFDFIIFSFSISTYFQSPTTIFYSRPLKSCLLYSELKIEFTANVHELKLLFFRVTIENDSREYITRFSHSRL